VLNLELAKSLLIGADKASAPLYKQLKSDLLLPPFELTPMRATDEQETAIQNYQRFICQCVYSSNDELCTEENIPRQGQVFANTVLRNKYDVLDKRYRHLFFGDITFWKELEYSLSESARTSTQMEQPDTAAKITRNIFRYMDRQMSNHLICVMEDDKDDVKIPCGYAPVGSSVNLGCSVSAARLHAELSKYYGNGNYNYFVEFGGLGEVSGANAANALATVTVNAYSGGGNGGSGNGGTNAKGNTPTTNTPHTAENPADPEESGIDQLLNTSGDSAFLYGGSDGTFRPEDQITRAETAMVFYRLLKDKEVTGAASFRDVNTNAWYYDAVTTLAKLGIITGYHDGGFHPNATISRAEFAVIAARFAKATGAAVSFTDVPEDYWAREQIAAAAFYGWIEGYATGTYNPENGISRAETAVIVNRMLGLNTGEIAATADGTKSYRDVPKTHWAYMDIMAASN
jgi:hypothetical protein